jgi:hypothetical protein
MNAYPKKEFGSASSAGGVPRSGEEHGSFHVG